MNDDYRQLKPAPNVMSLKLYSWNVNGIRAVWNKGLLQEFVAKHQPDILCLQETKATQEQVIKDFGTDPRLLHLDEMQGAGEKQTEMYTKYIEGASQSATQQLAKKDVGVSSLAGQQGILLHKLGYEEYWNSAKKKGYSGTAIFTKIKPLSVINGFPDDIIKKHDVTSDSYGNPNEEGRVIAAEFDKFYVLTVYTPNSKGDLSRLDLRFKQWDRAFLAYCKRLEEKKPVLFCGDLNVAHTEDDLANPKPNIGKHGFTDEEREGFDNFIKAGFIDTFRMFHKGNGHYSWWTHWANARARNVGWRIDYILVSKVLKSKVHKAEIHPNVMGSDHCPVSIEIDI